MRKLLSANFSRLWRSKIFWVLEALSAIAGAVFYILQLSTRRISEKTGILPAVTTISLSDWLL